MKAKRVHQKVAIALFILILLIPGCVVLSFYPLYQEDDLFNNELLTGRWMDGDSTIWDFKHPEKKHAGKVIISDSAAYVLKLKYHPPYSDGAKFDVHIINLDGTYFMNFYLNDYSPRGDKDQLYLSDLHMMPVHTFAKLTHWTDSVRIQWLDPDWLKKKLEENKISIRHENNGNTILLTAKAPEIQTFLLTHAYDERVFDLDMVLYKFEEK